MKVVKKQTLSHNCIVCGLDNPEGVKARFYEMEDGSLISLFSFFFLCATGNLERSCPALPYWAYAGIATSRHKSRLIKQLNIFRAIDAGFRV